MKSILIISRYFYPTNTPRSFRTTELAKELVRQGHTVTVVTPKQEEHEAFGKEHNILIEDLGQPNWKGIDLNGNGVGLLFKRTIRRILLLALEYPNLEFAFKTKNAIQKKKKNNEHYDLLISIASPHSIHWGVAATWENKNNIAKTWVADCGDPYMGVENDSFPRIFYFKNIEKWFCKKVDYLTIPVESAIPAYYPEFHHKIKVISQGFKFEDIKLANYVKNEIPHFAYAGGLIPGRREPKEFLEFLVNYPRPYKFDIYTQDVDMVKAYADRSGGRIKIKSYLPREELLFELSKLEFVVNFENAGNRQIPSKIIDYVITKRPILSINTLNFDKGAVEEFLLGEYKNSLQIENPEQYRIENVAKEFLNLVEI